MDNSSEIPIDKTKKIAFVTWFPSDYDWDKRFRFTSNTLSGKTKWNPQMIMYNIVALKFKRIHIPSNMDFFYYLEEKNLPELNRKFINMGHVSLGMEPSLWNEFLAKNYTHVILYNTKWCMITPETINNFINVCNTVDIHRVHTLGDNESIIIDLHGDFIQGTGIIPALTAYPLSSATTEYELFSIGVDELVTAGNCKEIIIASFNKLYGI